MAQVSRATGSSGSSVPTPSSAYYHTGQSVEYRKLVFATDYHFQSTGVSYVKALLNKALQSEDLASVVWDHRDSVFRVTCHASLTSYVSTEFLKIVRSIIGTADRRDNDSDDSTSECGSISEDENNQNNPKDSDVVEPAMVIPLPTSQTLVNMDLYPKEILKFEFRQTWMAVTSNQVKFRRSAESFDELTTPQTLLEIGQLSSSLLKRDASNAKVYIGSSTQEGCDLAVLKLNTIQKYSCSDISVRHVFYSEEQQNFRVVLRLLVDTKKRRLETTLVHSLHLECDDIAYAVITGMAIFDTKKSLYFPYKESKYVPVTPSENIALGLRNWEAFTYEAQGSFVELDSMARSNKSPPGSVECPAILSTNIEVDIGNIQASEETDKIQDWVETLPAIKHTINGSDSSWDSYDQYGQSNDAVPARFASTMHSKADTSSQKMPNLAPQCSSQTTSQPIRALRVSYPNIIDEDVPIEITSALQQPIQSTDSPLNTFAHHNMPSTLQRLNKETLLIELGDDSPIEESQQIFDEASLRRYQQTSSQKASGNSKRGKRKSARLPHPSPPRAPLQPKPMDEPLREFIDQMVSGFQQTLEVVRGYCGPVIVHATFGRILLSNLSGRLIETKDNNLSHLPDSTAKNLREDATCYFTKILTSVSQDVQYLMDTQEDNQRIWESQIKSWDVIYEFHYRFGLYEKSFSIEVDAGSSCYKIMQETSLGVTYVHGLKRHWDVAVTAIGLSKEARYYHNELGDAIKETLFVPEGESTPSICFEVPSDLCRTYQIEAIRVRRTFNLEGICNNAILQVVEYQDLQIMSKSLKDSELFNASLFEKQQSVEALNSWYEVRITSPTIDQAIQENEQLQLGSEASWCPSDIAESVKQLCYHACQMLKQMDGVGFYNNNGLKVEKIEQIPEQAPVPVFW